MTKWRWVALSSMFQYDNFPQMNIADCTDNTWASAFQETGEKVLNIGAQDLGRYRPGLTVSNGETVE